MVRFHSCSQSLRLIFLLKGAVPIHLYYVCAVPLLPSRGSRFPFTDALISPPSSLCHQEGGSGWLRLKAIFLNSLRRGRGRGGVGGRAELRLQRGEHTWECPFLPGEEQRASGAGLPAPSSLRPRSGAISDRLALCFVSEPLRPVYKLVF